MEKVIYKFDAENFTTQPGGNVQLHHRIITFKKIPTKLTFNFDPKFKVKHINLFYGLHTKSKKYFQTGLNINGNNVERSLLIDNKYEIASNIFGFEDKDEEYEFIQLLCEFQCINCTDSEAVIDVSIEVENCGEITTSEKGELWEWGDSGCSVKRKHIF